MREPTKAQCDFIAVMESGGAPKFMGQSREQAVAYILDNYNYYRLGLMMKGGGYRE